MPKFYEGILSTLWINQGCSWEAPVPEQQEAENGFMMGMTMK